MADKASKPNPTTAEKPIEPHPFKSTLESVKEGRIRDLWGGTDPIEKHGNYFARKRFSNGLIMAGILTFVGLTFFYTMKKMGQDDLLKEVDDRGYPKRK